MAHPQFVDGGDDLQIWWRVATKILNKLLKSASRE
jgi:hypothetical protein